MSSEPWTQHELPEVRGLKAENAVLRRENEELKQENERLKISDSLMRRILHEVAVDRNTDLMIASAFGASFDLLKDSGQLERMKNMGYITRIVFLDLDKMKVHNSIGDHDGGDAALAIVGSKLNEMYRRGGDRLMPLPELSETVDRTVNANGTVSLVARYQKGDEFLAAMIQPPSDEHRSRVGSLKDQKDYIESGFKDVNAKYRCTNPDYEEDGEYELDGVKFTVENGIATVPVSMMFGIVEAPVPQDRDDLKANVSIADTMMMNLKRKRTKIETAGAVVSLLPNAQ